MIERLGIKEGDLVEAVNSECRNSIKLSKLEFSSTPTKERSSLLIYLETSTKKTDLKVCEVMPLFKLKDDQGFKGHYPWDYLYENRV
ncbi:ubiquitin-domain-containing protein [Gigaspora margarita]|uniref:Ubiquitin-domain-containing protein n=1 Tax=Gigaspora margarita TaxID=4874 RepID=A0A8H4ASX1_GIGMA|nr:ubiquitin-domain-containing protein [Gigaspora margarita]